MTPKTWSRYYRESVARRWDTDSPARGFGGCYPPPPAAEPNQNHDVAEALESLGIDTPRELQH